MRGINALSSSALFAAVTMYRDKISSILRGRVRTRRGTSGLSAPEAIYWRALKNNFSAKMFGLVPVTKAAPPGTRERVTLSAPEALRTAFLQLGHSVE